MLTSEKKDDLLKAISYIKSKETVTYKKATIKDLMISEKNYDDENKNRNNNVKSFRQQEEFGLKKRIKP